MKKELRIIRYALSSIARNPMRTFLTMLGIVIGIASVIALMEIGNGVQKLTAERIASMGVNSITIRPGAAFSGGISSGSGNKVTITVRDAEEILKNCEHVQAITPVVGVRGQLIYGGKNWNPFSINGVNEEFLTIGSWEMGDGEFFSRRDVVRGAKVCVIGTTVQRELFGEEDPIGKDLRIQNVNFKIVGILKSKGANSMGFDQDDLALAPYTTVMKRILAVTYLQGINCSAVTEDATDLAIEDITAVLRRNHKLKDGTETTEADVDDFTIRSQEEIATMMNTTMDLLTILLGSVAGISLVVGGIGIMNIMYVSVSERTKEIGLRMSVGARGIDILSQFLIEAAILSIAGGVIGVLLGIGAAYTIKLAAHMPIFIQWWSIVMSFGVCTFIGIFFGWYPAKKAANMDPIEALRYE